MQKLISASLAGVMLATTFVASTVPASADPRQDHFVERYYRDHDRDRDFYRWERNRHRWDRDDYRRWYRDRYDDDDDDFGAAAAIFGLAAGALAAGALAGAANYDRVDDGWIAACSRKYRSFDPATGTYLGYDGLRHPCRL
jgi:hypothetical protein